MRGDHRPHHSHRCFVCYWITLQIAPKWNLEMRKFLLLVVSNRWNTQFAPNKIRNILRRTQVWSIVHFVFVSMRCRTICVPPQFLLLFYLAQFLQRFSMLQQIHSIRLLCRRNNNEKHEQKNRMDSLSLVRERFCAITANNQLKTLPSLLYAHFVQDFVFLEIFAVGVVS